MKTLATIILILMYAVIHGYSQDHQTFNNYTGDWADPGSWEIGTGILNSGDLAYIYGYITVNGDLSLDNGRDLEVFDTLVVTGNFTANCGLFGPYTDLTVHTDGILIILGDMTGTHSFANIDGNLIVVGEVDLGNWFFDPMDVDGHAYFFDDDPDISPNPPPNLETEDDIPYPLDEFFEDVSCVSTDTEDPVLNLPAIGTVECITLVPSAYANYAALVSAGGNATDNCNIVPGSFTHVSDVSDGNSCPEIITRTYSIDDVAWNTGTAVQLITVDDNTPPTASNPAPVSVQCIASVPVPNISVVTDEADNCTAAPVVAFISDVNNGGAGCTASPYIVTRTYSVTDACGNSINVTQTITAIDNTPPTASNPAPVSVQCIASVPAPNISVVTDEADNCTAAPVVAFISDVNNGGAGCTASPYIVTRTYSVIDACGNSINVTQTITAIDNTSPTASNPAPVSVQCIASVPAPNISVVTDEADNCTAAPVVAFVSDVNNGGAGCTASPYIVTRTYSVTDACGNSINVTQTITAIDNTSPTASNPAPVNVQCIADVPAPNISVVTDEADNCTAAPVVAFVSDVNNSGAGCTASPYIVTRTYSVTDACGNNINVTQTITAIDNTPPTASNPAPVNVQCIADVPAPNIAVVTDEADNCTAAPVVAFVSDVNNGGAGCTASPYIVTRTYSVTDACGNSINVTQTITAIDNTPPLFTNFPGDISVECDAIPAVAMIGIDITTSDNCDATVTIVYDGESRIDGACTDAYTLVRQWTATDDCGNSAIGTQTITVQDNTNPYWTNFPGDVTVECDAIPAVAVIGIDITASDNCDVSVTIVYNGENRINGSCSDFYTLARQWTANDNCSNYISETQIITVQDNTDPSLILPALATYECIADLPVPYADYAALIAAGGNASDNCGLNTSSFILVDEVITPVGNTYQVIRTYEISDNCGNTTQEDQSTTVEDLTSPIITCPGDVSECAENSSGANVSGIGLSSLSDNCTLINNLIIEYDISGATTGSGTGDASGTFFTIGISTLDYKVTDETGNESNCSSVITIHPLPVTSEISGNATPVCFALNEAYSVTGSPASKYLWTVPAGSTIISDTTGVGKNFIEVNFGSISNPITVIEVSDMDCPGEAKSLSISLQGCELIADFDMDKDEVCPYDTITFWSTSSGVSGSTTYSWDFGTDALPAAASGEGPHEVIYTSSGTKTIELTVTEGTTDIVSKDITVNTVPDILLTGDDRCGDGILLFTASTNEGTIVRFSDDGGINIISTDDTTPFEYTIPVNEEDIVTIWAQSTNETTGCSSEWSDGITLTAFPVPVTGEIIAEGNSTTFLDIACRYETRSYSVTEVPGSTHNWNIPALGITENNMDEITVDWNITEGEYTITVQEVSNEGCEGTISEGTVYVSDPQIDLGPDQEICEGNSYTFAVGSGFTLYTWHDGSTGSSYTGSQNETIWLRVEDDYQCTASDTVQLFVFESPGLNLGNDTAVCDEGGYEILVEGFISYLWSTGQTSNSLVVYSGTGQIWLRVTNEYDCSAVDTIQILECNPDELFDIITNTFTPNGDGVHDTWIINNIDLYPDAVIDVFDRTGRRVFHIDGGYANNWDGTYDGKPLPMDTYYYMIDLKSDQIKPKKGTVTIVR